MQLSIFKIEKSVQKMKPMFLNGLYYFLCTLVRKMIYNKVVFLCKFVFYKNFWYNKREKPYKIAIKHKFS